MYKNVLKRTTEIFASLWMLPCAPPPPPHPLTLIKIIKIKTDPAKNTERLNIIFDEFCIQWNYSFPIQLSIGIYWNYINTLDRRWNIILAYDKTLLWWHYDDVIMGAISSRITSLTIVYSTVYSDADQRKHQSSASLAFVWGIHLGRVNSPHKWPVTR